MKARSLLMIGAGAVAIVLFGSTAARSDDPVTSAVRYNREIVRIFERKCLACHDREGIAMPLSSYREVRPWSRAIREEIVEGRMPPASAVRGYVRLKDDIALTPRELATILTWVDGGVPRGDESDLPERPIPATVPAPDVALQVPPQQVPADSADVVRRVTIDTGLEADRWIRLVQIRPGQRRLVRAAFVTVVEPDGSSTWAASWVPWQTEVPPAPPGAFLLRRGARLLVEFHYRGGEAPAIDASTVALFFAPEGRWQRMRSLTLSPTRGAGRGSVALATSEAVLARDARVWGVRLEGSGADTSVEVTARKPDGRIEVLLWVPRPVPDWPAPFIFQDPVLLPAGSIIGVTTAGRSGRLGTRTILTLHETDRSQP